MVHLQCLQELQRQVGVPRHLWLSIVIYIMGLSDRPISILNLIVYNDRYNVIHDHIEDYSLKSQLIGAEEAVRITSAVGMKGDETNEEVCDPSLYSKGTHQYLHSCDSMLCQVFCLQSTFN